MSKPLMTDGTKRSVYTFRFHPNSTTDPDTTDSTYVVGGKEVSSIAYQSTGLWLVTLRNRHTKIVDVSANYHLATNPGAGTKVICYGTTEGMDAANSFYVALYAGAAGNEALTAPTYAATTWITVRLEVEESNA